MDKKRRNRKTSFSSLSQGIGKMGREKETNWRNVNIYNRQKLVVGCEEDRQKSKMTPRLLGWRLGKLEFPHCPVS